MRLAAANDHVAVDSIALIGKEDVALDVVGTTDLGKAVDVVGHGAQQILLASRNGVCHGAGGVVHEQYGQRLYQHGNAALQSGVVASVIDGREHRDVLCCGV